LLQLGDDPLLFLSGHLQEMFLKEVFGLLSRARGEKGEGEARQSGY
jgi:hypothetical protein